MPPVAGLVIGKFMPPHRGHLHLIDFARRHADRLTVLLFTKSTEPIPGDLREAWLRRLLPPGVALRRIAKDHPTNFQDPAIWDLWMREIHAVHPERADVVFSSEDYGAELARRLGAQHHPVDPARAAVPVSATLIRERPLQYWEFIPPPVRPYFVKRVAILGAESTGKTTLAQDLAAHFGTVWVPEYARGYLEAKGGPCTPEDIPVIARAQAAAEDALAEQANRVLICDTTLRTTWAWSDYYFGSCPAEVRALAEGRRYDLALLTDLDVPWAADGLRDCPHDREWFDRRFRAELEQGATPWVLLSGPRERRLQAAAEALGGLLT